MIDDSLDNKLMIKSMISIIDGINDEIYLISYKNFYNMPSSSMQHSSNPPHLKAAEKRKENDQ